MPKKIDKNLIVGLDIGTSKTVIIIASMTQQSLEVLGFGEQVTEGLKKGIVVNIEATVNAIQGAITAAEAMTNCRLHSVYANIAGSHINSQNSTGMTAISQQEVSQEDIDRVIEGARAVLIPADRKIIHVIPQQFKIDQEEGILDPLGMSGVRLEADIHLVTGSISAAQNLIKCVRSSGLEVEELVLQQLAAAEAVLSADEKKLGVCLLDIGAGTTSIAVYINGALCHTAIIPIAGNQVTHDLAYALQIPIQEAEDLKIKYGHLNPSQDQYIEVRSLHEQNYRKIAVQDLARVISARYQEILSLVQKNLASQPWWTQLGAGIVLTGGSSQMPGLLELSQNLLNYSSRLGQARNIQGLPAALKNPKYSTVLGLLVCNFQNKLQKNAEYAELPQLKRVWGSFKNWFQGNF